MKKTKPSSNSSANAKVNAKGGPYKDTPLIDAAKQVAEVLRKTGKAAEH
jgi:hypothetical protein